MFFFAPFAGSWASSSRLGDYYFIGIPVIAFWTYVALAAVMGVAVAWLANRTQPVIRRGDWDGEYNKHWDRT